MNVWSRLALLALSASAAPLAFVAIERSWLECSQQPGDRPTCSIHSEYPWGGHTDVVSRVRSADVRTVTVSRGRVGTRQCDRLVLNQGWFTVPETEVDTCNGKELAAKLTDWLQTEPDAPRSLRQSLAQPIYLISLMAILMSVACLVGAVAPHRAAPAVVPVEPIVVGPGPGFRLVRTHPLGSTAKRRLLGVAFTPLLLLVAFPRITATLDGDGFLLAMLGGLVWTLPVDRLFVARERITGLHHFRRELWVRPAQEAGPAATVVVDGREEGLAADAQVSLTKMNLWTPRGRSGFSYATYFSLVVILRGRAYEIERGVGRDGLHARAMRLAAALHPEKPTVRTGDAGKGLRQGYASAAACACLIVPAIAVAVGTWSLHFSLDDPRFTAIGLLAVIARAADSLKRLADVTAFQLDARAFDRAFPGAEPARPARWLTQRTGRRILVASWVVLLAGVGTLALGPLNRNHSPPARTG